MPHAGREPWRTHQSMALLTAWCRGVLDALCSTAVPVASFACLLFLVELLNDIGHGRFHGVHLTRPIEYVGERMALVEGA